MKNALFVSLAVIGLSTSVASADEIESTLHHGVRPPAMHTPSYGNSVSPGDFEALGYTGYASTTPSRSDSSTLQSGMRPDYR
jgi:hypothetical protein